MNKLESQLPMQDLAFEGKAGGKGGASLRRFFGLQGCAENHIRDGDFQTLQNFPGSIFLLPLQQSRIKYQLILNPN
jgi:hypothetical protein